jgi:hypothetical protein
MNPEEKSLDEKIEERLQNSNWDEIIAVKIHKKIVHKRNVNLTISGILLSGIFLVGFLFSNYEGNDVDTISLLQSFSSDSLVEDIDEFISFLD